MRTMYLGIVMTGGNSKYKLTRAALMGGEVHSEHRKRIFGKLILEFHCFRSKINCISNKKVVAGPIAYRNGKIRDSSIEVYGVSVNYYFSIALFATFSRL